MTTAHERAEIRATYLTAGLILLAALIWRPAAEMVIAAAIVASGAVVLWTVVLGALLRLTREARG